MISMLQVKNVCALCGTSFMVDIDAKEKDSFCPAPNCYGKKSKCVKCDRVATYNQPDENTGNIIDVCIEHFTLRFGG